MSGPAAAGLTTAVAVLGGGMAAGHLLAPTAGGARPAAFVAVMLALGAWRGAREYRVRAEWHGRAESPAARRRWAALGAAAALAVAGIGYAAVHG